MFIKAEILIWLLLTVVLLFTPIVLFFKHHKHIFGNIQNNIQDRSARRKEAVKIKLEQKQKNELENQKNTPDIHTNDNDTHNTNEAIPEKEIVEPEQVYQEVVANPAIKEVKSEPPASPVPPTPQKNPLELQKEKERNQKKFDDIRISALANKERGKAEEYEKKLIEGLMLQPDNKEFIEWLSDHYFVNQQYIKALSLLKKLVNEDPNHHKAIRQIGQIYIHQDDLDTAKILIEKAISEKPDNPKYYISLVDIHYTKNNLKEAVKAMEKVLKLRPTNQNYLLSIATLHEENAEPSKALYYYGKVIELDPLNENAKIGISRLT